MTMRFGIPRQSPTMTFFVDGKAMTAFQGDTVAGALFAAGIRAWRRARSGEERGLLCGIGICFDCLVTVDGQSDQRACQTLVEPGMLVETNLISIPVNGTGKDSPPC